MTRGKTLAKVLEEIRKRRVCAYLNERCDCKYGAENVGQMTESGNGCPEMRCAIHIIGCLTDKEIERALKRKPPQFFFHA